MLLINIAKIRRILKSIMSLNVVNVFSIILYNE